jgi:hypothetical protein
MLTTAPGMLPRVALTIVGSTVLLISGGESSQTKPSLETVEMEEEQPRVLTSTEYGTPGCRPIDASTVVEFGWAVRAPWKEHARAPE